MYTCGVAEIQWTYSGPSAPMSFNITNVNVVQQAPSASTTTTAAQRRQYSGYGDTYLPQIDEQLATQLDPLVGIWRWSSANVPQGWYRMLSTVQGVLEASSSTFFVQNGTNVGCVLQFYPTTSSSSSSSSSTPTSAVQVSSATSSKTTSHTGAVAGGIIGGAAAVILAIGAIIIIIARRRRRDHMRRKTVDPSFSFFSNDRVTTPFNPTPTDRPSSSPVPLNPIPVGLSSKELARLRSSAVEPTPGAGTSSQPTTGPTPSSEARTTTSQSEVEYLRREVQRLRGQQQIRTEGFEAPPSYGEARSPVD
jgi:hypothetical protein